MLIPGKPGVLCGQRTLVAFTQSRSNRTFEVLRRDERGQTVHRQLPWPQDANPDWDQGPRGFDPDEQVLILIDAEYRTHLRYLDSGEDVDLGLTFWGEAALGSYVYFDGDGAVYAYSIAERKRRPLGYRLSSQGNIIGLDASREAILTCDWDGVRSLSLRPRTPGQTEALVLDSEGCISPFSTLTRRSGWVQYDGARGLRSVPIDGSAPAHTIWRGTSAEGGPQLLAVCKDGTLAYSLDPKERYGVNIGDGWIGTWRFMERGREARFSSDCARIRFKEHAANLRRLGELRSTALDSHEQRFLARNVGFYAELPDRRLMVADDLAVIGSHNRLSLIDEDRGTTRTLLAAPIAITGVMALSSVFSDSAVARDVLIEIDTPELRGPRHLLFLTLPP